MNEIYPTEHSYRLNETDYITMLSNGNYLININGQSLILSEQSLKELKYALDVVV